MLILPLVRLCSDVRIYSPKIKARMRLQAAESLLHLSTVEKYARFLSANFVLLALNMQVCRAIDQVVMARSG